MTTSDSDKNNTPDEQAVQQSNQPDNPEESASAMEEVEQDDSEMMEQDEGMTEPLGEEADAGQKDLEEEASDPSRSDEDFDEEFEATVESVVEAILFASDEPLTDARLVNIVEAGSVKQVKEAIKSLNSEYEKTGRSFRIEKIAGGYQMMTLPGYHHWLKKLLRVRTDNKLSQAALETLAIISYKQPIIRADIEAIRGVAAGEMIRSLMYKGLVKIVGRAEILGRPMLYGTTRKFLEVFGLNTLKDLPQIEELKKPEKKKDKPKQPKAALEQDEIAEEPEQLKEPGDNDSNESVE